MFRALVAYHLQFPIYHLPSSSCTCCPSCGSVSYSREKGDRPCARMHAYELCRLLVRHRHVSREWQPNANSLSSLVIHTTSSSFAFTHDKLWGRVVNSALTLARRRRGESGFEEVLNLSSVRWVIDWPIFAEFVMTLKIFSRCY